MEPWQTQRVLCLFCIHCGHALQASKGALGGSLMDRAGGCAAHQPDSSLFYPWKYTFYISLSSGQGKSLCTNIYNDCFEVHGPTNLKPTIYPLVSGFALFELNRMHSIRPKFTQAQNGVGSMPPCSLFARADGGTFSIKKVSCHTARAPALYFAYLRLGLRAHFPSELALSPLLFNRWLAHLLWGYLSSPLLFSEAQTLAVTITWPCQSRYSGVVHGSVSLWDYELGQRKIIVMCHIWPVLLRIRTVST